MVLIVCLTLMLVASGCGGGGDGDGDGDAAETRAPSPQATATPVAAAKSPPAAARPSGTRITVRRSRFGRMLWGPKRRAIYIFERDGRNRTRCFGACAKAWPPVYTKGRPTAGPGARKALLGSIRRRDGRRQVTYAGQPLYLYAHEGPREVRCHNVNLNGGLWWVVGANGERRP
jgi:predicted lipoprotein with Yx(FWY)xxD motif